MCHTAEYREGLCCSLWRNPEGGHEMGSFSHKVTLTGTFFFFFTSVIPQNVTIANNI